MIEQITPYILTCNESANIARTLGQLHWAKRVVVLDSFSDDDTESICGQFPNVDFQTRRFDSHANQCNHVLTLIDTPWVLSLDADYVLSRALVEELLRLEEDPAIDAYRCSFGYMVDGQLLRASLYPPRTVLYRRDRAHYIQEGHTQRVIVDGKTSDLNAPVYHDDRKPFSHWIRAQHRYARAEQAKITSMDFASLRWQDRVRRIPFLSPIIMVPYLLFARGLILDGRAGFAYMRQRVRFEWILQRYLLRGPHST